MERVEGRGQAPEGHILSVKKLGLDSLYNHMPLTCAVKFENNSFNF